MHFLDEQSKLQSVFDHSLVGLAIVQGENFVFEKVNTEFQKLVSAREYVGKRWLDVYTEIPDSPLPAVMLEVFKSGTVATFDESEVEVVNDHGLWERRYYNIRYSRILDAQKNPYGVLIETTNVTRIVHERQKTLDVEDRLRNAVEIAKIGFFDWDLINKSVLVSEHFQEHWGVPRRINPREAIEQILPEFRCQSEKRLLKAIANGTPYHDEYRILRKKDGAIIWIEAQGSVIYNSKKRAISFFGTTRDITARKKTEEDLKESRLEAERANSAKSAFLANMSHEIRTPLGAILGFADLLKNKNLQHTDIQKHVSVINRNAQHLLRIIDDILDLSKVEAGKMLFEKISFSVVDLLNEFSSIMSFRAQDKGIIFQMTANSPLPRFINSDPTRLRQILNNIVGNAIKFTDQGKVELNLNYKDNMLRMSVIDTGTGISKEQAEKLFQPFHQADISTTRKFGGTGLGLVLTRKMAEVMGGEFRLESSQPGKGSTFIVSIRAEASVGTELVAQNDFLTTDGHSKNTFEKSEPHSTQSLSGMKILVIDDSLDNQDLLGLILTLQGATVDLASDGEKGSSLAIAGGYNAILCDIQMPGLDGYGTLKALRSQNYKKPIIALTAHAMKEEKIRILQAGFNAFLTKPVHKEKLIQTLLQWKN